MRAASSPLSLAAAAAALLAAPVAGALVEVSIETEFTWLDDGMPASLAIGQPVTFDFSYDDAAPGITGSAGDTFYPGALTAFALDIPDAPFSAGGLSGDITYTGTELVFEAFAGSAASTLDGQELTRTEVVLFNAGGTVTAAQYGLPVALEGWSLDSWTLTFHNPGSGSSGSSSVIDSTGSNNQGLIQVNVPEPAAAAALLGLGALGIACLMRRRSRE